jgi:hypothetical protein
VYTYLKDKNLFAEEKELRISLSALGFGHFALQDGSIFEFPPSLSLAFDFQAAFADNTIVKILHSQDTDTSFLKSELQKLRIVLEDT